MWKEVGRGKNMIKIHCTGTIFTLAQVSDGKVLLLPRTCQLVGDSSRLTRAFANDEGTHSQLSADSVSRRTVWFDQMCMEKEKAGI